MPKVIFSRITTCILCLFIAGIFSSYAQDDIPSDTLPTPFRQGRWLSGISGSISSSTNKTRSTDIESTTNQFGISLDGGKFIKDRWLIGGIVNFEGSDFEGNASISSETFFVGPMVSHYFSDSPRGSLFMSFAPGYSRYIDNLRSSQGPANLIQESSGSGFGINVSLGYSFVIEDRIAFDIGFDISQAWFSVEVEDRIEDINFSENIALNNIAFKFGFRILLNQLLR